MNDYTGVIGNLFCEWISSINVDVIWYALEEEIGGRELWCQVEFGYFLSRLKQYHSVREFFLDSRDFDNIYFNKRKIFVDFLIGFPNEEFDRALIELKTGDWENSINMFNSMITDAKKLYSIYNYNPKFIVGISNFQLKDLLVKAVQQNHEIPIEYLNEFLIYGIYVCIGQIKENTYILVPSEEGDFLN